MPDRIVINGRPDLRTERLLLRPLRKGDEAFLAMLETDPDVMRFIHHGVTNPASAAHSARLEVEMAATFSRRFGKWMVELHEPPARIGWVEAFPFAPNEHAACGVGYEFAPAFWGQGYATEAVSAVMGYLMHQLKEAGVIAYVRPDNERSRRVLEKVGFRFSGQSVLDDGRRKCNLYTMSP